MQPVTSVEQAIAAYDAALSTFGVAEQISRLLAGDPAQIAEAEQLVGLALHELTTDHSTTASLVVAITGLALGASLTPELADLVRSASFRWKGFPAGRFVDLLPDSNEYGWHVLREFGQIMDGVVRRLVRLGAPIDDLHPTQHATPLQAAVASQNFVLATALIRCGADVERDKAGGDSLLEGVEFLRQRSPNREQERQSLLQVLRARVARQAVDDAVGQAECHP